MKGNMNVQQILNRNILVALAGGLCLWTAGQLSFAHAAKAGHAPDSIWVHDSLYGTIGTDTSFNSPPSQSTDVIFSFADSGLMGQRSVAVYAPGDPEYNGGRWHVMAVAFTASGKALFDPDNDGTVNMELTNAEDLMDAAEMGLVTITDTPVRFECPLLPQPYRP
jgi:hypothetical protein